jgi:hypothetical protein
VQSGGPIPFPSQAGPRTLARSCPCSPCATDRPTPPISDTAARYCASPHVRHLSPTLSPTERARAAHVARPRRVRAAAGATRQSGPDPMTSCAPRGTPTPGTPSPLPFFPSRPCCRRAHSAARCSVGNPIFTPLRPLSRALEPPLHSPYPDHHLRPPEPASPS